MSIEAMKQALEALYDSVSDNKEWVEKRERAVASLSQAIAATEESSATQEPFDGCVMVGYSKTNDGYFVYGETAPQEFCAIKGPFVSCAEAEKAMRDPNAELIKRPAQPKAEQEPVARVADVHMSRYTIEWTNRPLPEGTELFDGPQPKHEPLTGERIDYIYAQLVAGQLESIEGQEEDPIRIFARALEAAHGIKEKHT